jgi:hypothetical protein
MTQNDEGCPTAVTIARQRRVGFRPLPMMGGCICSVVLIISGCANVAGSIQNGSLPRPGLFTFFKLADTTQVRTDASPADAERQFPRRGIVYTVHGGFIDLAHVYNTAWLAHRVSDAVLAALKSDSLSVKLDRLDGSDLMLSIEATGIAAVADLQSQGRSRLVGECVAFQLMTWHEIITWFGFESTSVWTEKPSAFTYEDTTSNIVGVQVFDPIAADFSENNLGNALRSRLEQLGLVDKGAAMAAINAVKGLWWSDHLYTRRMVYIRGKQGVVTPWLVPDLSDDENRVAAGPLRVPCATDTRVRLQIKPSVGLLRLIRKSVPSLPDVVDATDSIPFLVEVVGLEVERQLGASSMSPN